MSVRQIMVLVCLGVGVLASLAAADEKKPADAKSKDLQAKATKAEPAAQMDFCDALGLCFNSLTTIGARIDQLRRAGDPVGLAGAANELAVAEKVSGHKAPLSSADLLTEAVTLAKMRNHSAELKAVAMLDQDEATDKDLNTLAAKAEKREAAEIQAAKSGEVTKGVRGSLICHNNTQWTIQVQVNGSNFCWVNPYGNFTSRAVGDDANTNTIINAYAMENPNVTWTFAPIDQNFGDYNLTFNK